MSNLTSSSSVRLRLCALDKSRASCAENTEQPAWEVVEESLAAAFQNDGFVDLSVISLADGFVEELTMKAISGKYRIIAMTRSSDPGSDLFEWWEPEELPFRGLLRFGEDEWDARTISEDVSHAKKIFHELFVKGDVVEGMQQMRSRRNRKPRE